MKQINNNMIGKNVKQYISINNLEKVYLASKNKKDFAVKVISKNFQDGKDEELRRQLLFNEIKFLSKCNNPNVVKMIENMVSDNNYYIVMEYCNQGDLEQRWKEKGKIIPEKEAIQYMKQILNGMRGLHEKDILHRDLKLANIFISNNSLKIGDLGMALECKQKLVSDSFGGTRETMAPEVVEFKPYGIQADMFSLGAIYYQLLFGQLPFSLKSNDDFLKDVKSNPPNFERGNVRISKESKDLLTKMLQYNPQQRLTFNELFNSPIFYDQPTKTKIEAQTFVGLFSKKIDMKQNQKIYEENEEKFKKITNQTMLEIKEAPEIEFKKVDEPKEDLVQLKIAQEHTEQENFKQEIINQFLERYIQERNTITSLANIVQNIYKRDHPTFTYAFFALFMIAKRLRIEMNEFVKNLQQKNNVYECPFFDELIDSIQFQNLVQQCQEDWEVINLQFRKCQYDYQQSIKQQQDDDNLKQEQYEYPTQLFDENYKNVLQSFFSELLEEKYEANNYKEQMKVLNLISDVLEAILHIKKNYIWCQNDENDSELQYDDQCLKRKEELIENKINLAFV